MLPNRLYSPEPSELLEMDDLVDEQCSVVTLTQVAHAPDTASDDRELCLRAEKRAQFKRLKDEARALFGAVKGLPGVRSPQKWAEMLEKAGDEIGNGRFLVRQLGAERYLE